MISMQSMSSRFTASMMVSIVTPCGSVPKASARMLFSPAAMRSANLRCTALPLASVSRQPFLPQWQMTSLSNTGVCPNSPANPDLPV